MQMTRDLTMWDEARVWGDRLQRGFTIMEMMVAIAILAIMAVVSVPTIRSWIPNQRLRSAANELYTNLQWAKLNAIQKNETWTVSFDPDNLKYQILDGSDTSVRTVDLSSYGSSVDFGFGEATTEIGGGGTTDPVTYTGHAAAFNSRGMSGEAGYVYLKNDQDRAYAVGNLTSGFVMVRRWQGSAWD
jgi:type IV fimbrial biogenesis protein FimT